jgi:hypothetical protein
MTLSGSAFDALKPIRNEYGEERGEAEGGPRDGYSDSERCFANIFRGK